jgi:DNA mismatch endonuclease, patch repair protein
VVDARAPAASSEAARSTMRANRSRDTGPEMAVRRVLHARGLRYRVDHPLPFDRRRRADIAFTRAKVAVFIDGCFWHGCPEHGTTPRTNTAFWSEKIARNRARDQDTTERLEKLGWAVLRFWEHSDPLRAAASVACAVGRRLSGS